MQPIFDDVYENCNDANHESRYEQRLGRMRQRGQEGAWVIVEAQRYPNTYQDEEYDVEDGKYAANGIEPGELERHCFNISGCVG